MTHKYEIGQLIYYADKWHVVTEIKILKDITYLSIIDLANYIFYNGLEHTKWINEKFVDASTYAIVPLANNIKYNSEEITLFDGTILITGVKEN